MACGRRWQWVGVALLAWSALACVEMPAAGGGRSCCESNQDCAEGWGCTQGVCAARCTTADTCSVGEVCGAMGTCVPASTLPNPCGQGTFGDTTVVTFADAGSRRDGGGGEDVPVTMRDASGEDHTVPTDDAGRVDSGRVDAGRTDAGRTDAGRVDSGVVDAGRTDAAGVDSGRVDAGLPDAARPDANMTVCDPGDMFEPNNTLNNASNFPGNGSARGAVCGGDEDWFDLRARPMDPVTVTVVPDFFAVMTVEVHDRNGALLATAQPTSIGTYLANVTSVGRMALRITSAEPFTVPYRASFVVGTVMCTDDALEPNDAQPTARLVNGTVMASICPGNVDFFGVDAAGPGAQLSVSMTPSMGSGDIDIIVRDPNGAEVGRSERPNGTENVNVTTSMAGRYVVEIYGFPQSGPNASQGNYTLTMTVTGGMMCINDNFEPNDSPGVAPPIFENQLLNLVVCPMDVDMFALRIERAGTMDVVVNGGPLMVELLDRIGTQQLMFTTSPPGGTATLSFPVNQGDAYNVRITGMSAGLGGTPYTLVTRIGGGACTGADTFEPNNNIPQAALYTPPQSAGVTCGGDEDWFILTGSVGDTVTAVVGTAGIVDVVEIYDAVSGQLLAQGQPVPGGVGVLVTDPSSRLAVRIVSFDPSATDYVLTVNRSNPNMCIPDNFEPNETRQTARAYTAPVQAQICANDRDFFSVAAQPGPNGSITRIRVQMFPFPDAGNLDVRLRAPDGTQVAIGNTGGNNPEFLDVPIMQGGTYTVEVYGAPEGRPNAGQGSYFLQVDVLTQDPNCPDDFFEDNDDFGLATQLSSPVDVSAHFCNGDPDFYVVFTNNFEDVTVTLTYPAPPRLRVTVFNSSGQQIGDANTGSGMEQLFLPGLAPDAYFVRVQGPAGAQAGRDYQLTWSGAGQQCMGDLGEPNEDIFSATPINIPSFASAVMCGFQDVDVYALTPTTNRGLQVTLATNTRPDGPLDAFLLGPDGFSQLASTFGQPGGLKTLAADITQSGTHWVQVVNSFGDPSPIPYTLTTAETATLCTDDMWEENDGPLDARVQMVNTNVNGMACNQDQDWFAYDLVRNNTVTITLSSMSGQEDFILLIGTNGGDVIAQGTTFQPIVATIPTTGRYFVLPFFQVPSTTGIPYVLRVAR